MPKKKRGTVARKQPAQRGRPPGKKTNYPKKRYSGRAELFPTEYLKDLNAKAAAVRCGYAPKSAHVTGHNLFIRYKTEIDAAMGKRILRTHVTVDRVLQEIAYIAFSDETRLMEYGDAWVRIRPSNELHKRDSAAIAGIEFIPGKDGNRIKFKMHDKMKALHMLCQHLGLANKEGDMVGEDVYRENVARALNGDSDAAAGIPTS